jgi:4-amino-4-deoxy-L-arabinose transferase-like glycosyltransferase
LDSEQVIPRSIALAPGARRASLGRARTLIAPHAPLAAVLGLSALLNSYALSQNGYANTFYSAAVKSMLGSLHDLLYNSFDPGGLITIDKPPLAVWLQTASAKLFGFSPLSLLLPEAIAGVLAVAALYWALVRPFGRSAALSGALALAVFPTFVAVSRDNVPDPLLILLMTLACVAALQAIESGRLRTLLLCALLIALAFNTKTLAAYLVVPPIALAYMVCAPGPLPRRASRLAAAGLVMVALSLSWSLLVDFTPASQRPYVGGSTDNSELGLTFAYNGVGRLGGQEGAPGEIPYKPGAAVLTVSGAAAASDSQGASPATSYPTLSHGHTKGVGSSAGSAGPLRLLGSELGRQAGWLLPFALGSLIALLLAAIRPSGRNARGPDPRDPRLAAVLVLGGWFLVEAVVLSAAGGIVHPYYVSALAPGAAAMLGAGAVLFIELAEQRDRLALLLAIAAAATIAVQTVLLERDHYLQWLPALLIAGGLLALAVVARPAAASSAAGRVAAHRRGIAVALMLALLLVAPTAYAASTWLAPVSGTFPAAGPHAVAGTGGLGLEGADPPVFRNLVRYLDSHDSGRRFSVLTVASVSAAPLILMGTNAAALGGYGGNDPALDGPQLARLVARSEARYVLLGGAYSERGGNKATAAVLKSCRQLTQAAWGGPAFEPYSYVLFDCKGREAALSNGMRAPSGARG